MKNWWIGGAFLAMVAAIGLQSQGCDDGDRTPVVIEGNVVDVTKTAQAAATRSSLWAWVPRADDWFVSSAVAQQGQTCAAGSVDTENVFTCTASFGGNAENAALNCLPLPENCLVSQAHFLTNDLDFFFVFFCHDVDQDGLCDDDEPRSFLDHDFEETCNGDRWDLAGMNVNFGTGITTLQSATRVIAADCNRSLTPTPTVTGTPNTPTPTVTGTPSTPTPTITPGGPTPTATIPPPPTATPTNTPGSGPTATPTIPPTATPTFACVAGGDPCTVNGQCCSGTCVAGTFCFPEEP